MSNTKVLPEPFVLQSISTNGDLSFFRTNIMPNVESRGKRVLDLTYDPDSKYNLDWIDPLSPAIRRLRRLPKAFMRQLQYTGAPITSISYQVYGITSLWYPILLVSGFMHPHEVPNGAILYLPNRSDLDAILKLAPRNKRGTVVKV